MKKTAILLVLLLAVVLIVPASQTQAARTYRVKNGDTAWNISRNFNIPVNTLLSQNDISNPANLYIGQELIITRTNNSITITFGGSGSSSNNNYSEYYVKPGDTLWKIATRFNTTLERLVELNDSIDYTYQIYVGQRLIIPGQNDNDNSNNNNHNNQRYTYYTVKAGDILWNIAQKFDTTVERLVELNDIKNSYDLYVGRKLIVEVNNPQTDPEDEYKIPEKQRSYTPYSYYEIKEGDLIWSIADRYGIRVSELVKANNIKNVNQIKAGKVLVIPLEKSSKFSYIKRMNQHLNNYYRVRSNETLSDIANYFNVPEEGIRIINRLNNKKLYTGQWILMPVSPAFFTSNEIYTVKRDSLPLHELAYQKGVSIRSILQANYLRDNNAKFQAGTRLIIPKDEASKATWIDYENGKPVNSWFNQ